jgi:hypothetical protein
MEFPLPLDPMPISPPTGPRPILPHRGRPRSSSEVRCR